MYNLYQNIYALCCEHNITPGGLCSELGFRRSVLSDLKSGRKKTLDTTTLMKIADYFDVTIDYLLNGTEKEKAPAPEGEREISDDEIKLALFGGKGEVTDEMWEEAKFAVQLIKDRHKRKKGE